MKKCWQIILLLWVSCSSGLLGAQPVEIGATTHALSLAGYLSASPIKTPLNSPQEALALYQRGGFQKLPGNLGRGYQHNDVWLAFELQAVAGAPKLLVVEVGPAFLDRVTAYQVDAKNQMTLLGSAGDQVPPAQVGLLAYQPSFAIPLAPNARITMLLQIKSISSQAAIVNLYRAGYFPAKQAAEGLLLGSIFSISFVMFLLTLGLYAVWHDRIYLLWLALLTTSVIHWFMVDGLAYRYLDWHHLPHLNQATSVANMLSLTVHMFFVSTLFQFKTLHRWLHAVFMGWASVALMGFLLGSFLGYPLVVGVANFAGLPALVIAFIAIVWQMVRRQRESLWFGPMFLLYLCAVGLSVGASLGLLPYSDFTFYGRQFAGFLNLLSLQLAMLVRAWQVQRHHVQERGALMAQLTQSNQQLEVQVADRTQSLSQALRIVQQAESEQRQLLSMAAHEFRTPAAMIKASLDSLKFLQDSIPPEVDKRLSNMRQASVRLVDLSNSLIDQDRLIELTLKPRLQPIDLCQVVEEVLACYPAEAQVLAELPLVPVPIHADAALLSIALHNLIGNALHHGRLAEAQIQPVSVTLSTQPGGVTLQVADCGPGIADDKKLSVFERFHAIHRKHRRASDGAQDIHHGSGLGLAIVQSIALAHSGCVQVRDRQPQGAVLLLTLPYECVQQVDLESDLTS
jgi:signal transduction histidine kinase